MLLECFSCFQSIHVGIYLCLQECKDNAESQEKTVLQLQEDNKRLQQVMNDKLTEMYTHVCVYFYCY